MIKTKRIMTTEVLGEKQDQKGSQAGGVVSFLLRTPPTKVLLTSVIVSSLFDSFRRRKRYVDCRLQR